MKFSLKKVAQQLRARTALTEEQHSAPCAHIRQLPLPTAPGRGIQLPHPLLASEGTCTHVHTYT